MALAEELTWLANVITGVSNIPDMIKGATKMFIKIILFLWILQHV